MLNLNERGEGGEGYNIRSNLYPVSLCSSNKGLFDTLPSWMKKWLLLYYKVINYCCGNHEVSCETLCETLCETFCESMNL